MQQSLSPLADTDLPTPPEEIMRQLEFLQIPFTLHHHKPVFTVAESETIEAQIPGTHCRNLFLCDKKKNMALVVLPNDRKVDMKSLSPVINMDRLSFGSSDRLWTYLGVKPGSVCPFAIINDAQKQVRLIFDKDMMDQPLVNYHPLLNTMTVGLSPQGLIKFMQHIGREPEIIDLKAAAPADQS